MNPNHWNKVYSEKSENQVSWFQPVPHKSIELIEELNLSASSTVIDIGGGESHLVDYFLKKNFSDINVLDISEVSLEKLQQRLGEDAKRVNFIATDITLYRPDKKFDLWHDRATFHFLTEIEQVEKYLIIVSEALKMGGNLIISTFAPTGPEKCSGLTIKRYSDMDLKNLFGKYFQNTKCVEDTHLTPWGSKQDFVYCGFKKI